MIRIGQEWSGQGGLDRPKQTKTSHDMLGWVRTCQEVNSACQDGTGQVTAFQDRIGQALKP